MTIFRCRVSRSVQALLQVVQLALLTGGDSSIGFQHALHDQPYKYTQLALLAASIITQCILIFTVYRIDRSYDHRNQVYNEQHAISYRDCSYLWEMLTLAPNELNEHMTRNRFKESTFLIASGIDLILRIARLVLTAFWAVQTWRYFFVVLLLEQMIFFLGQVQYVLMLSFDEGYLRALMISMDFIMKRERAVVSTITF